jgi:TonB family protein
MRRVFFFNQRIAASAAIFAAACLVGVAARANDCTIQIKSLEPVGSTQDGKYVVYQVDLQSVSAASFSASMRLTTSSGDEIEVNAPPVVPKTPNFTTSLRFVTNGAVARSISLSSLTFGINGSPIACMGEAVAVASASAGFGDGVFTSAIKSEVTSPINAEPLPLTTFSDARILKKPVLDYPQQSQEGGESGIVVLYIWIGVDGKPLAIRLSKETGFALLDDEAIKYVQNVTYAPATVDGKPVVRRYKFIVEFVLDLGGPYAPVAVQRCPVQISSADFVGYSKVLKLALYRLSATLKTPIANSADIALGTGNPVSPTLTWRGFTPTPGPLKTGFASDTMSLVWRGPPIIGAWVTATRLSDTNKAGDACDPYPINMVGPLDALGAVPPPDPAVPTEPEVTQRAYDATFASRTIVSYPRNADGSYQSGDVEVIVSVDATGRADSADVIASSGNAGLDSAALGAALSSSYRLHSGAAGPDSYIYLANYHFVSNGLWSAPVDSNAFIRDRP